MFENILEYLLSGVVPLVGEHVVALPRGHVRAPGHIQPARDWFHHLDKRGRGTWTKWHNKRERKERARERERLINEVVCEKERTNMKVCEKERTNKSV